MDRCIRKTIKKVGDSTAQVIERQITKLPQTETKLAKKEISMLPRLFETEIHQPNKAMNRNINRNK